MKKAQSIFLFFWQLLVDSSIYCALRVFVTFQDWKLVVDVLSRVIIIHGTPVR